MTQRRQRRADATPRVDAPRRRRQRRDAGPRRHTTRGARRSARPIWCAGQCGSSTIKTSSTRIRCANSSTPPHRRRASSSARRRVPCTTSIKFACTRLATGAPGSPAIKYMGQKLGRESSGLVPELVVVRRVGVKVPERALLCRNEAERRRRGGLDARGRRVQL